MSEREIVTEVVANVAVAVDVPTTAGDDLPGAVAEALADVVRHVDEVDVRDVERGNGTLTVTVESQLTLHFPPSEGVDAEGAREYLAGAEPIASIQALEVVAGPYEIERW